MNTMKMTVGLAASDALCDNVTLGAQINYT